jgi:MoaA/NifB/PqqE/SkfB family radical SAM enzyme
MPASAGDYYVKGKPHQIQSSFLGNLHDLSLQEIWRLPTYVNFRRSWQRGGISDACRSCLKMHVH